MCTVTVVPIDAGVRLVCNRDERRARALAQAPLRQHIGSGWVMHPVDPDGGGTWIGVNDAGLALTLLNRTRAGDSLPDGSPRSRGLIIPPLLLHDSLDRAVASALAVDPHRYRPFHLVGVQGRQIAVISSDGRTVREARSTIAEPCLFTSSSLGDELADSVRRPLFDRLVLRSPDTWLEGQWRFHGHQWPGALALSVRMSRADARTVSRSTIDAHGDKVGFHYAPSPDPDCRADVISPRGVAC